MTGPVSYQQWMPVNGQTIMMGVGQPLLHVPAAQLVPQPMPQPVPQPVPQEQKQVSSKEDEEPKKKACERPCEHNSWDNVRVVRKKMTLRCRVCQKQWGARVETIWKQWKCDQFSQNGKCPNGDSCKKLHLHYRKQGLEERVSQHGSNILKSVRNNRPERVKAIESELAAKGSFCSLPSASSVESRASFESGSSIERDLSLYVNIPGPPAFGGTRPLRSDTIASLDIPEGISTATTPTSEDHFDEPDCLTSNELTVLLSRLSSSLAAQE